MADRRPINLSIQILNNPQVLTTPDRASWMDIVRRAEDTGFYSLSVPDHLGPSLPQLAPLVALASAAAVTTRLRLAITVLDNDFRHPVMLAKEVATLDLLSEGRVDMGLGAGWLEEDYTKTGIVAWDPPAVRLRRLMESVSLLRKLFSGETVDFTGEFYRVDDFQSSPPAVQSPVPLMIGGRKQRLLTFGAREAQILSIGAEMNEAGSRLAAFEQQLRWVQEAGAFERDDFTLGVRIHLGMVAGPGESGREVAEQCASQLKMPVEEVLASPFIVAGDTSMIRDQLLEVADRYGATYFTLSDSLAWTLAPIVDELSG